MMANKIKKLITILLTSVMLVSAFGITQVSHICSMALSGTEKVTCEQKQGLSHNCCKKPTESKKSVPAPVDCCKDVIKHHQIRIVTVINDFLKLDKLTITEVVLFFHTLIPVADFEILAFDSSPEFPPDCSGRQILNFHKSYLI